MTPIRAYALSILPLFTALLLLGGTLSPTVQGQDNSVGPALTPEIENYLSELTADRKYPKLIKSLLQLVDKHHYLEKDIDLAFSLEVYDSYITQLDPLHNLFLAQDLADLEQFRPTIQKALTGRNLNVPYSMYRLRQKRASQALLYQMELLSADAFDFDKEEYLEIDREDAAAPANWVEWRDYWRRAVKNQLLLTLLGDTAREQAVQRLQKRLGNRLKTLMRNDSEDVLASFVNAALNLFDPHSTWMPPQEYEYWISAMRTELEGIGAVLTSRDDYIEIVRLVEGGPAQSSGRLAVGDRITGVISNTGDELVDVVGMPVTEVVRLIRGKKGKPVALEILAADTDPGAPTEMLTLVRDVVPLESQKASSEMLEVNKYERNWKVGMIKLPSFYDQAPNDPKSSSASQDIRKLIGELKQQGMDGLILDLRNNGGGYLQEAMLLTSLFVQAGPFVQIRHPNNITSPDGQRRSRPIWNGPLTVLVNRLSASAAEIVAAAIQDYKRGLVLGTTTFGKGTVQNTYDLQPHGQLKLTRSKFYRVSGGSTQHKGVIPDLVLPAVWSNENVGESTSDSALPFDTIGRINLRLQSSIDPDLELLQQLHEARRDRVSHGLAYVRERRRLLDDLSENNRVPLNISARKERQELIEQRQLDLENRTRIGEGEEPFANWDDYVAWNRKRSSELNYKPRWVRILQEEAAHVLADQMQQQWAQQIARDERSTEPG